MLLLPETSSRHALPDFTPSLADYIYPSSDFKVPTGGFLLASNSLVSGGQTSVTGAIHSRAVFYADWTNGIFYVPAVGLTDLALAVTLTRSTISVQCLHRFPGQCDTAYSERTVY